MVYFGPQRYNRCLCFDWVADSLSPDPAAPADPMALAYMKFMSETEDMSFKYYSESEWRIVCPCGPSADSSRFSQFQDLVVDVNGEPSEQASKYLNGVCECELREFVARQKRNEPRLKYLLPLDYELAVIVYPSPEIKILAECDEEIRQLVKFTRNRTTGGKSDEFYNRLGEFAHFLADEPSRQKVFRELTDSLDGTGERMMLPMEIDLDTISHF